MFENTNAQMQLSYLPFGILAKTLYELCTTVFNPLAYTCIIRDMDWNGPGNSFLHNMTVNVNANGCTGIYSFANLFGLLHENYP